MKKFNIILLAAILMLSLGACNVDTTKQEGVKAEVKRVIVDGNGDEVVLPEEINSIVCVGVGALRYSTYMGASDLVIGVEDYEQKANMSRLYNYVNFEHFSSLPVIGTNGEPFIEEIVKLSPDIIVMSSFASISAEDLRQKTGIPVVVVPGSDTTLDDKAYRTIEIMGVLYSKEERAQELIAYMNETKEDLKKRTSNILEEDKPSVYVGGVSFKGHHGFDGTEANYGPFSIIGAKNLADTTGQDGAFNIDLEQVLAWDPDMIFLDFNGKDLIKEQYGSNPNFFDNLSAVKEGKVYSQISFRSSATNLETALADAYYAGTVIFVDQFADVDIVAKTGEIFQKFLGANPYQDLVEAGYEFKQITIGE